MTLAKDPKAKKDGENKHPRNEKFNHKNSTLIQSRTQNAK
jgi:hypothetical protein